MSALQKLIIIGAGGFGREMYAWAEQSLQFGREWTIKGFLDDNLEALVNRPSPGRILSRICDYEPQAEDVFICAMGQPAVKRRCSELMASRGGQFTRLIHRSAVLGHEVVLSEGVVLCPYTIVSANNRLGRGVAINLHSSVDHDATVGDWCQINCHCDLTGGAVLEEEVFLGSHASVLPGVRVGARTVVGAGAIVNRDLPPDVTAVGMPARALRLAPPEGRSD